MILCIILNVTSGCTLGIRKCVFFVFPFQILLTYKQNYLTNYMVMCVVYQWYWNSLLFWRLNIQLLLTVLNHHHCICKSVGYPLVFTWTCKAHSLIIVPPHFLSILNIPCGITNEEMQNSTFISFHFTTWLWPQSPGCRHGAGRERHGGVQAAAWAVHLAPQPSQGSLPLWPRGSGSSSGRLPGILHVHGPPGQYPTHCVCCHLHPSWLLPSGQVEMGRVHQDTLAQTCWNQGGCCVEVVGELVSDFIWLESSLSCLYYTILYS